MKLTSNAFRQGEFIPKRYTCDGEGINPALKIEDIPKGTKSMALILDDPDSFAGIWVHWMVKDIHAETSEIKENSVPGMQILNSFGKESYGGPCPRSGIHRYFFRVYALKVDTLEAEGKEDFYKKAEQNAIAKAELMGRYGRAQQSTQKISF